ncbi:hypothetical protein C4E44_25235 [Pseudomonas sp. MWU12-2312b]|uniref:hypothetical protein n=1 Tax=Pseudomonas moorei TaxID=395599 RepID=UPI000D41E7D1|nr:hypothetical protein [Pseudomonas moorei]PPA01317.1 hypothetical protein C4E44_25235 [Pseudomonas sp. MWU12-2312b]
MKDRLVVITAMTILAGPASAEPAKQMLVPGSNIYDFGIECRLDDKVTFYVGKNSPNNQYRVARNIFFTEVSNGKVAISLQRGFTDANQETTYLTAPAEHCEMSKL